MKQFDTALLCRIANAAFLQPSPSKDYGFDLGYTVQWQTLGRLACTCSALGQHLSGLLQLEFALPALLYGQAAVLPPRWELSLEPLLATAVRLPLMSDARAAFTIPSAVVRFNLPIIIPSAAAGFDSPIRFPPLDPPPKIDPRLVLPPSPLTPSETKPTRRQQKQEKRERHRLRQQQSIGRRFQRR